MVQKSEVFVSVEELKKEIDGNKVEFLFDLRNPDEFDSWRIEMPEGAETLNIPQLDFVGEEEKYLDRLPKNKPMVVVCAHGDASKYSAELLQKEGFRARSLLGGMDAWSEYYETHKVHISPDIYQIYRVAKGCITHVLISEGEAVVIDAVRHLDRILLLLEENNAKLLHVIDTHLQADHISGGRELAVRTGAEYWINPIDAKGAVYQYKPLNDHTILRFGSSSLEAIHSPGHTPGSVSLLLDKKFLFSGDTIMKTSIGRPDLGGMVNQWSHLLYITLNERYSTLQNEIVILPTHAASIKEMDNAGLVRLTFGEARKAELYQIRDEKIFAERVAASLLKNPERYQDIRKVNLGLLDPDEDKRKELEIGKNLCGMAAKNKMAA